MVHVHAHSGILSAYGISLADTVEERQVPSALTLVVNDRVSQEALREVSTQLDRLSAEARQSLRDAAFADADIHVKRYLNLRYQGTDSAIMTSITDAAFTEPQSIITSFRAAHNREFGFLLPDRPILVDDIRIRVSGKSPSALAQERTCIDFRTLAEGGASRPASVQAERHCKVYFEEGWKESPVYDLASLKEDASQEEPVSLTGPAMIIDRNSTIVVEPCCQAFVVYDGSVVIHVMKEAKRQAASQDENTEVEVVDPIQLSIFSHRFMSIAERKNRTLLTILSVTLRS